MQRHPVNLEVPRKVDQMEVFHHHVEGHVAMFMREHGIGDAVPYQNNTPCRLPYEGDRMLPHMRPRDARGPASAAGPERGYSYGQYCGAIPRKGTHSTGRDPAGRPGLLHQRGQRPDGITWQKY